jgi:Tfp pilus assembly protein PilF
LWILLTAVVLGGGATALLRSLTTADLPWQVAAGVSGFVGVAGLVLTTLNAATQEQLRSWIATRFRHSELDAAIGSPKGLPRIDDEIPFSALGIHDAGALPPDADDDLDPHLPTYVERPIDSLVANAVRHATKSGGLIVVRGEPGRGKSRCLYEAIISLTGWRFYIPDGPDELVERVTSGYNLARTVIWLDEITDFVADEQLPYTAVRRLLDGKEPVIIVGTIWLTVYAELTHRVRTEKYLQDGLPVDAAPDSDVNKNARQILERATTIDMPDDFTAHERQTAAQLGDHDPRLALAARHEGSAVTQALAGEPEVVAKLTHGEDPYGKAVLTACAAAVRAGHPTPVPASVLEPVAERLLTPARRAHPPQDWFARGIAWACRPVRGSVAAMEPYAEKMGEVLGYVPSDFLVRPREGITVPKLDQAAWSQLVNTATPTACGRLARTAYRQEETDRVEAPARRAASVGDAAGLHSLANLVYDQGDLEQGERLFLSAYQADPTWVPGVRTMGWLAKVGNDIDAAHNWYTKALDLDPKSASTMDSLGDLAREGGDAESARHWYEKALEADPKHTSAMIGFAMLAEGDGDIEAAKQWCEKALVADPRYVLAMVVLGLLARGDGDVETARAWYEKALAADPKSTSAMAGFAMLAEGDGDIEAAKQWCEKALVADPRYVWAMF